MSKPISRRVRNATVPLLLAAALTLSACGKGDDVPQGGPPAGQVTVVTLQPETVTLTRELAGRAAPSLIAEVRPQVSGIVQRKLFTEGGLVRAGQPLYQLDDASYRADASSASAGLARAEATLATARLNARRSAELAAIDAVSKQDNDNAQAALRQAQADVQAARAGVSGSSVTLGRARITAPISGRIGRSDVTQGALVTANQAAPLATVQRLDPMYVDLNQSAAEWLELRRAIADGNLQATESLPVSILLEDGSTYGHDGRMQFAEVSVDPATGSYALRVEVPNPQQLLLPGMYVRAVVSMGERRNAILAPQQGIARDAKGNTTAMVVDAEGKVEVRPVVVSQAIGDRWLVESGLQAGDKLIVEGLQKVRPGMPVNATERGAVPADAAPAGATPNAAAPNGTTAPAAASPAAAAAAGNGAPAQPAAADQPAQHSDDAAQPAPAHAD